MFKKVLIIFLLTASSTFSVGIYLDEDASTGIFYDSVSQKYMVIPLCDVELALRFDNSDGILETNINAGFEVYIDNDHDGIPDTDGLFNPISTSGTVEYPWINCEGCFPLFGDYFFSVDGIAADTVGVIGAALNSEQAYPAGANKVILTINTGGLEGGNILCIDSAFFPDAGFWRWYPGIIPEWGGPYCFEVADIPTDPPVVTNLPTDTLFLNYCGKNFYDFETVTGTFILNNSTGDLNVNNGLWSYIVDPLNDGQTFDLDFTVYDVFPCLGGNHIIPVKIDITGSHLQLDLNQDCQTDVSDMVYFIDYIFNDGELPAVIELTDCDGNGTIDISDLVYAIDYFFNDGPPPQDPWQ